MVREEELTQLVLKIVEKIKKEYQPEKIILFGSYAYGKPDRDSDLDFFIVKKTADRPIDRRVEVIRIVSDPNMRISFEPIVLTPEEVKRRVEIGDQFVKEIIEKGEVLYAGNIGMKQGLEVILQAADLLRNKKIFCFV